MMGAVRNYFNDLVQGFGQGWNRFWFQPSDPAPLGLVRLGAGLVAFYLVLTYTPDLETFFGADGLVSREMLASLDLESNGADRLSVAHQIRESMPRYYRFSYLDYLDSPGLLKAGHWAGLAVLALFAAGLFTRVTSVLALLVVLSYIHRGPLLTAQVEPVLAFVLFYLCLGPAGAEWSLDRWLALRRARTVLSASSSGPKGAASDPPAPRFSSAATISLRLIQVHLALLYVMMAVGKLSSDVWWSGSALWWLIAKTESRLVDFTWLHGNFARLLVDAMTNGVVLYQLAFPILVWNRLARPLVLGLGVIVWGLLALIAGMVPFAFMMLVASLAFVPGETLRAVLPDCCGARRPSAAA
ncbi:MAG TPA: hypothetical protein VN699_18825 [Pirellulales bacterium]|nr:hypothetical protein [Pirellulales bacterium]